MKKILWTFIPLTVLIFGFQNCGDSSFVRDSNIDNESVSSVLDGDGSSVSDTEYKEDNSSFKLMENNAVAFSLTTQSDSFYIREHDELHRCFKSLSQPLKKLLRMSKKAKVSFPHPDKDIAICNQNIMKNTHLSIGHRYGKKLYLIAKSSENNCYTEDPYSLMEQGKRVLLLNDVSLEEIMDSIYEAKLSSDEKQGEDCKVARLTEEVALQED